MGKEQILVTGGAGFLGSHLCKNLERSGYGVRVFDLKPSNDQETILGDLRDPESPQLREALQGVNAVIHLAGFIEAGESYREPRKYVQNNILGSFNLLEAMRETQVKKLIFSSSAGVYGEPDSIPIPESAATHPINTYGATKAAVEALMSSYAHNYDLSAVALRYFNLYGPGENHIPETHLVPRFIYMMKKDMDLTVWGNGSQVRDYVHVEDVAAAHILALNQGKGFQAINLSSGSGKSVNDMIYLISDALKVDPRVSYLPERPGDPKVLEADTKKAEQILGWKVTKSLEDGIRETVKYFEGKEIVLDK